LLLKLIRTGFEPFGARVIIPHRALNSQRFGSHEVSRGVTRWPAAQNRRETVKIASNVLGAPSFSPYRATSRFSPHQFVAPT
jgi:hypothetical protein